MRTLTAGLCCANSDAESDRFGSVPKHSITRFCMARLVGARAPQRRQGMLFARQNAAPGRGGDGKRGRRSPYRWSPLIVSLTSLKAFSRGLKL